jgi:pimeloyl-ACP methyl ester carboxylesterase
MSDLELPAAADPIQLIAHFEHRAHRHETPCGQGVLVWRRWGSGPPVLLAHGSEGSWSHWIRNIDALAAHYTVWAPDLPGFGDSAPPPTASHESIVAVLAEGLRHVLPRELPVPVVGFSFGGVIAAYLAALCPELARQIIIVDSGGLDTPRGKGHLRLQRLRGLQGAARREAVRANLLAIMLHHSASADDLALQLSMMNGPRRRLSVQSLVLPDKLRIALPQVTCSVAAIWGEFDGLHPDPAVQEAALQRILPHVAFRTVPDAGHWSMYERADAFNQILLELLASTS